MISHTATSSLLIRDSGMLDVLGYMIEDGYRSSSHLVDALDKFRDAEETTKTGFNLAFQTDEPCLSYTGRDQLSATRFANCMKGLASMPSLTYDYLVQGHNWSQYEAGTVVDVGVSMPVIACYRTIQNMPLMAICSRSVARRARSLPC
jgi:hypothetical protein